MNKSNIHTENSYSVVFKAMTCLMSGKTCCNCTATGKKTSVAEKDNLLQQSTKLPMYSTAVHLAPQIGGDDHPFLTWVRFCSKRLQNQPLYFSPRSHTESRKHKIKHFPRTVCPKLHLVNMFLFQAVSGVPRAPHRSSAEGFDRLVPIQTPAATCWTAHLSLQEALI